MFEREWNFYLDDMILFSEKVLAYTEGLDQESFEADEKAYDATFKKIGINWRGRNTHPRENTWNIFVNSLASGYCNPEQADSRLFGNRQRYSMEYYPGRYSGLVERVEKIESTELVKKKQKQNSNSNLTSKISIESLRMSVEVLSRSDSSKLDTHDCML